MFRVRLLEELSRAEWVDLVFCLMDFRSFVVGMDQPIYLGSKNNTTI